MKHICLSAWIAFWVCTPLFAQDADSLLLSAEEFNSVTTVLFGNVISPQSNTNIGNYVAADLKDNKVNFNGNIAFADGSFLGIKLAGAASDGFLPLFTGAQLNPSLEVDLQYNLTRGRKVLRYRLRDLRDYREKEDALDKRYEDAQRRLGAALSLAELDSVNLRQKRDREDFDSKIESLARSTDPLKALRIDSLNFERGKMDRAIGRADARLAQLRAEPEYVQEENLNNQTAIERRALKEAFVKTMAGTGQFDLNWLSFGFGLSNQSFNLFNESTGLSPQSYTGHNMRVQYTWYHRSAVAYESYYVSVGAGLTLDNNLDTLTGIEHTARMDVGSGSDQQFIDTKKKAFRGTYQEDLRTYRFFLDAYWFLFKDDAGAFHLYPDYEILQDSRTAFNLNLGFLLAFRDSSGKNKVNTEVYLRLNDIFTGSSDLPEDVDRTEIGIRVTVPFQLN